MAVIQRIREMGNQMQAEFNDGTKVMLVPTMGGMWLAARSVGDGPDPDPEPEDPDNPPTNPDPGGTGDLYNPWAGYRVTGDWENHASYSQGGTDYPLGYNTPLLAPASGTLEAGTWTDAAGRRSVLRLDRSFGRVRAASTTLMNGTSREAAGPMTAIVLQHQAAFQTPGHYNKGDVVGYSGASAAPSSGNYGGDVHLHVHGLDSSARRLDFTKFIP